MMKVHDCNKNVKIEKVRGDKVLITIQSKSSGVREFSVRVDEQGLHVSADDVIVILPGSSVDCTIDYKD